MRKLLLLLLSASSLSAMAENNGYYVGWSVGMANIQGLSPMTGTNPTNVPSNFITGSDSQFGVNVDAGYSFNQNIAVEADFMMIPSYSYSNQNSKSTYNDSFLFMAMKGSLPIWDQMDLFGKIGYGVNFSDVEVTNPDIPYQNLAGSGTNVSGLIGLGVSYNISKDFAVMIEDDYMMTNRSLINADPVALGNVNFVSLGVNYKF